MRPRRPGLFPSFKQYNECYEIFQNIEILFVIEFSFINLKNGPLQIYVCSAILLIFIPSVHIALREEKGVGKEQK